MSPEKRTFADTAITCQECGVEFIWTVTQQRSLAEQGISPERPTRCPACRRLATPADRHRGRVKWYNRTKGWGFITLPDGNEVFAHRSALAGDLSTLEEGDLVEFGIEQTPKGPQAVDVRQLALDTPADGSTAPPETD